MRRLPEDTCPIGILARRSRAGQENQADPGLDKMDHNTHFKKNLSEQASAAHNDLPEAAESTAMLSGDSKYAPFFLKRTRFVSKLFRNLKDFLRVALNFSTLVVL